MRATTSKREACHATRLALKITRLAANHQSFASSNGPQESAPGAAVLVSIFSIWRSCFHFTFLPSRSWPLITRLLSGRYKGGARIVCCVLFVLSPTAAERASSNQRRARKVALPFYVSAGDDESTRSRQGAGFGPIHISRGPAQSQWLLTSRLAGRLRWPRPPSDLPPGNYL